MGRERRQPGLLLSWGVGWALRGKVFGWMSQSRVLWVCCCSSEQHALRLMLFGFSCSDDSSQITQPAGECRHWEHTLVLLSVLGNTSGDFGTSIVLELSKSSCFKSAIVLQMQL